jgi:hypothetical protein
MVTSREDIMSTSIETLKAFVAQLPTDHRDYSGVQRAIEILENYKPDPRLFAPCCAHCGCPEGDRIGHVPSYCAVQFCPADTTGGQS